MFRDGTVGVCQKKTVIMRNLVYLDNCICGCGVKSFSGVKYARYKILVGNGEVA